MVRLNPKVKIAGIELSTVMKNLSDSRVSSKMETNKKGCIDVEKALEMVITDQLLQRYEFVELATHMKEKYVHYHTLNESEKSYFRDCADSAIEHKSSIMEYVMVSSKVKKMAERKQEGDGRRRSRDGGETTERRG